MHGTHDLGSPTSHGNTPKPTIPNDAKFFIAQPANKWVLRVIALLCPPPRTPSRKLVDLLPRKMFQGHSGPRGLAESQAATV